MSEHDRRDYSQLFDHIDKMEERIAKRIVDHKMEQDAWHTQHTNHIHENLSVDLKLHNEGIHGKINDQITRGQTILAFIVGAIVLAGSRAYDWLAKLITGSH